jgi:hypothetical protein
MTGELVGLALVAIALGWFLRGRKAGPARNPDHSHLSYEEMEAAKELREAEEEVRERDSGARPEDEEPGNDWGPGTPRSY